MAGRRRGEGRRRSRRPSRPPWVGRLVSATAMRSARSTPRAWASASTARLEGGGGSRPDRPKQPLADAVEDGDVGHGHDALARVGDHHEGRSAQPDRHVETASPVDADPTAWALEVARTRTPSTTRALGSRCRGRRPRRRGWTRPLGSARTTDHANLRAWCVSRDRWRRRCWLVGHRPTLRVAQAALVVTNRLRGIGPVCGGRGGT